MIFHLNQLDYSFNQKSAIFLIIRVILLVEILLIKLKLKIQNTHRGKTDTFIASLRIYKMYKLIKKNAFHDNF
jgi:hypothetical protein